MASQVLGQPSEGLAIALFVEDTNHEDLQRSTWYLCSLELALPCEIIQAKNMPKYYVERVHYLSLNIDLIEESDLDP